MKIKKIFSWLVLMVSFVINVRAQAFIKGKIYNDHEGVVMIEYREPLLGYINYFEYTLIDGVFQYQFDILDQGAITIHTHHQSIEMYLEPGDTMLFHCDALDVYGTVQFEGRHRLIAEQLTFIRELQSFADKFKNNATQALTKREQQYFNQALQQIAEPGSEQNQAFIHSYVKEKQQAAITQLNVTALSPKFVKQYIDTTFVALAQNYNPIYYEANDSTLLAIRKAADSVAQWMYNQPIDYNALIQNEGFLYFVSKLVASINAEKPIEINNGYRIKAPFEVTAENIDSFVAYLEQNDSIFSDTRIPEFIPEPKPAVRNRIEQKHRNLQKIFKDSEVVYKLLCHSVANISNFGSLEYQDHTAYMIEQFPHHIYNDKLLSKIPNPNFLSKGSAAPDFIFTTLDNKKYQLQKNKKVKLITFGASWCLPCMEEWSKMFTVANKLQAANIEFVMLLSDVPNSYLQKELTLTSNVFIMQASADIFYQYNASGMPRFYLIDADGKVITTATHLPSEGNLFIEELKSAIP